VEKEHEQPLRFGRPAVRQAPEGDRPVDPRESFRQASDITICMSYDLIDKLRFWEKETLKLTPPEIEQRLPHLAALLERLKVAYLEFSDVDF